MLRNPYDIYGSVAIHPEHHKLTEEEVYSSLNYSESPYQRTPATAPEYVPASLLSSMIASGSPRQYIDPWDLENYAYLQRNRGSETETTTDAYQSESGCESTASSQFYYTGAADKQDYYRRLQRDRENRGIYGVCNGDCENPMCENNIYGTRQPQLQFPPPPSPYEYDPYEDSDAQTVMECQECSLSCDNKDLYSPTSTDIYYSPQPIYNTTPAHFSLSKKGLLQIDYSCNWNCLDMDFNFGKLRL